MLMKCSSSSRNCSYMEKVVGGCGNDKNQRLRDRECNGGGGVGRVSNDAELLSTWPPRHNKCSFCKKSLKSSQALGGHMNVHRRARALLRSQSISISPTSSPSSSTSPWNPTNISIAHHPLQNDETHFIPINPNLNCPLLNNPHLARNPSHPYLLSHLPMISTTSASTLRNINPHSAAASAYKDAPGGQYHHADQPFNGVIRAKKHNCILVEDKFNGLLRSRNTYQNDALVTTLSLGNGLIISNSTDQQDINLELHL